MNSDHLHTHDTDLWRHIMTVAKAGFGAEALLGQKYSAKRKVFSLPLKNDGVEQCFVGVNSKCGVQSHEPSIYFIAF